MPETAVDKPTEQQGNEEQTEIFNVLESAADEITTPGEEGLTEVDPLIDLPESEEKPEEPAAAAAEVESEPEPVSEAVGNLERFREMLSKAAEEQGIAEAKPDPSSALEAKLEEARARERELLERQIEDLKAQRQTPEGVDVEQARSEEFEAAARLLAERKNIEVDEARDELAITRQLVERERERWEREAEERLEPLRKFKEQAEASQKQHAAMETYKQELSRGLASLYKRGGTAKQLVEDFVGAGNEGWNTPLGRALVGRWSPDQGGLPPALTAANLVEGQGLAAAALIDNAVEQGLMPETTGQPNAAATTGGIRPQRRPARPRSTQGDHSEIEAKMAEEMDEYLGTIPSVFNYDEWPPSK